MVCGVLRTFFFCGRGLGFPQVNGYCGGVLRRGRTVCQRQWRHRRRCFQRTRTLLDSDAFERRRRLADRSETGVSPVRDRPLSRPRHQNVEVDRSRQREGREHRQHTHDAVREVQRGPSGLRRIVQRDGVQSVRAEARPGRREEQEPGVEPRGEPLVPKKHDRPHAVGNEPVDEHREQVGQGLPGVDREGDLTQCVVREGEAGRAEQDDRTAVPGRHSAKAVALLPFGSGRHVYVRV